MSRSLTFVLGLGAALAVSACGFTGNYRRDPGFAAFDTPSTMPEADRQLGVSVGAIPIRLATLISRPIFRDEPWIPEALSTVRAVRVYMYEIEKDTDAVRQQMEAVRSELLAQDWEPVAVVREDGGLVAALVMPEPEIVRGIVVMFQEEHELVLVNVIGRITPEKIGSILEGLEIELPLMAFETG